MAERTKGSFSIPSPTSSRIARLSLADPESDRKACCCRVYGKAEQSSAQPHGAQHPSAGQSGRATEDAPTAAAPLAACSAAVVRPLYPSRFVTPTEITAALTCPASSGSPTAARHEGSYLPQAGSMLSPISVAAPRERDRGAVTAGFSPLALPSCFPFPPLGSARRWLPPAVPKEAAQEVGKSDRAADACTHSPEAGAASQGRPQTQPRVSRFIGGSGGSQPPARTSPDAPHPTASIPCRARTRPELLTAAAWLKGSSLSCDTHRRRQADAKHRHPRQISSPPTHPKGFFLRAVPLVS